MPGSLDKFRDLKYNKKTLFEQILREKDTIEKIQNKSWTPEFKNRAKQTYYVFRKKGIEITDHGIARHYSEKKGVHLVPTLWRPK